MASALRLRGLRAGREEITHTHEAVVRSFAVTWGGSDGAAAAAMVELTGQLLNRREATRRGRSRSVGRRIGGANKKIVEGGEATYGLTATTGATPTAAAIALPPSLSLSLSLSLEEDTGAGEDEEERATALNRA